MSKQQFKSDIAFNEQLRFFYNENRQKIRSKYKALTRKFLAYNDKDDNLSAYLRKPQFEALEIYVFIKEFTNNAQVSEIFNDWRNRSGEFAEAKYYSTGSTGQMRMGELESEMQTDILFKQMKQYKESYANYIYALTMGLGKTILMATCIFYEFLLANKFPSDKRFCHNALVFAPDKTVLQSLREIMTFDKSKVVPPEYANVLDANIKFHFLDDNSTTLNTLDNSDFNIIISNTQKIIVKEKHKDSSATTQLFMSKSPLLTSIYGDDFEAELGDSLRDKDNLTVNQRFMKLCRLSQLGVYVDEAHHLFGADLEKLIHDDAKKTSLRNTINMLAEELNRKGESIVACYNYTGTPYVKKQVLPEVVYAYGLKESILDGYLKETSVEGYENVKSEEFLRDVIKQFWERYGENTYEDLLPKLAIFSTTVKEANEEVRPIVEKILAEMNIPLSKILINVGDEKVTKDVDIRNFNNLDVTGTEGSKKQFLLLVNKGREGWNCRSLFGVALFRSPSSKIFVLQATMRCLRQITDEQQTASVFLSKDNYDILNDELDKNFNMEIRDMKKSISKEKKIYKVRVLPPPRKFVLKDIKHEYSLIEKEYTGSVTFKFLDIETAKYEAVIHKKDKISHDNLVKERVADDVRIQTEYSAFTLVAEVARYLNLSCLLVERILTESTEGMEGALTVVNRYNDILYDRIVPVVFNALFEVKSKIVSEDRELILLKEPADAAYYEFSADPMLVIEKSKVSLTDAEKNKTFHADTYCFDSNSEKECFNQYVGSDKVEEVYFTGMFTSNQGDLAIKYYDPESRRMRQYYPDFFAKMSDGSYQLIEVKGDNKIDDILVLAKAIAAQELAVASGVEYIMYKSSDIMKDNVLDGNA